MVRWSGSVVIPQICVTRHLLHSNNFVASDALALSMSSTKCHSGYFLSLTFNFFLYLNADCYFFLDSFCYFLL